MDKEVRDDYKKRFGERLREARERLGIRHQRELAKLSGITFATINYYESGERIPDAYMVRKLAETLECSADYLLLIDHLPNKPATDAAEITGIVPAAVERMEKLRLLTNGRAGDFLSALILCKDFSNIASCFDRWRDAEKRGAEIEVRLKERHQSEEEYNALYAENLLHGDKIEETRYFLVRSFEKFLDDYAKGLEVGKHGNEAEK